MSIAEDERNITLRDLQKAETRSRVVDAARALFSEKGYEAATIREIARRAGVAPGSVFTTFTSKTELLQEIIFSRYQEMVADVIEAAQVGGSARERLKAGARKAYEIEFKELRLLGETIAASYRWTEAEEQENRRRLAPLFSVLINAFSWAKERGEIRKDIDPLFLADIIFSCYLRNFRHAMFDGWSADRIADQLSAQIDLIFRGAQPD